VSDWDRRRREKERQQKEERLKNAERVLLTEDNVKTVAKKTGRSVYELQKILMEAEAKGHACHIRIPPR
jgi:hypothetical protein